LVHADLSLARGQADAAITDLRAVQRDQPDSPLVQRALTRAYLLNDDMTLAEETLRAAVRVNAADVGMRLQLARLLQRAGKLEQALPVIQKLADEQPSNIDALDLFCNIQLARHDFASARRIAGAIQTARPDLAAGDYLQGLADAADGKSDRARAAFERAAAKNPRAIEPLRALARLDIAQQENAQALARINRAVDEDPQNPLLQDIRGEVLLGVHRYYEAVGAFQGVIDRAPLWPKPYHDLAAAQLNGGNTQAAVATLKKGVNTSSDAVGLMNSLAELYQQLGMTEEAIALYEDVLKERPHSTVAANNLALLLAESRSDRGSLTRARDLAQPFARSRNPSLLDTWGWVQFHQGQTAAAVTTLQTAVDELPRSPVLRYHLAMAQLRLGSRDLARDNLQQAVDSGAPVAEVVAARTELAKLR
jgi:predicted Zn-dependent protease